jgi:tetratricopeptide (TPR) repeat protein
MQGWIKSRKVAVCLTLWLILPVSVGLQTFEPVVAQMQTKKERRQEAVRLYKLGQQQSDKSQYREALETFEKALVIFREIGDRVAYCNANDDEKISTPCRLGSFYTDWGSGINLTYNSQMFMLCYVSFHFTQPTLTK